MGKKTRPLHTLSTGVLLQIERYTQTESNGMEKLFHENENGKNKIWVNNTWTNYVLKQRLYNKR